MLSPASSIVFVPPLRTGRGEPTPRIVIGCAGAAVLLEPHAARIGLPAADQHEVAGAEQVVDVLERGVGLAGADLVGRGVRAGGAAQRHQDPESGGQAPHVYWSRPNPAKP